MKVTLPDGRGVQIEEYGDPNGVPALWLHGAASSRLEAGGLADEARAAGVRLLAPDRPGVGGSDPVPNLTVTSYTNDLVGLLDHLGIKRAAVAGLSNGGMFAMATGALHPDRVTHVVAANSASPIADAAVKTALSRKARTQYAMLERKPGLATKAAGKEPGALAKIAMRFLDPDFELMNDPDIAARVAQNRAEVRRQPDSGYMLQEVKLALGAWGFDHRAVPVPVILLSGEKDAGLGYARVWAQELPNGRLETMPGGHVGVFRPENRRRVAALLAEVPR